MPLHGIITEMGTSGLELGGDVEAIPDAYARNFQTMRKFRIISVDTTAMVKNNKRRMLVHL